MFHSNADCLTSLTEVMTRPRGVDRLQVNHGVVWCCLKTAVALFGPKKCFMEFHYLSLIMIDEAFDGDSGDVLIMSGS